MYTPAHKNSCEKRRIKSNNTFWMELTEKQARLYSTPKAEEVFIKCSITKNKIILEGTSKILLNEKCVLTPHITLKARKNIGTKFIHSYLLEFNITLN